VHAHIYAFGHNHLEISGTIAKLWRRAMRRALDIKSSMNNETKLAELLYEERLVGALNSPSSAFGILETTDPTLFSVENVGEATRINGN